MASSVSSAPCHCAGCALAYAVSSPLYDLVSGVMPLAASTSRSTVSACAGSPARAHAPMAALQQIRSGARSSVAIVSSTCSAGRHSPFFSHAVMHDENVMVLGDTPAEAISGNSSSARCHSPAEPHAAMAELNVTVSGATLSRRICLSILSASFHRPAPGLWNGASSSSATRLRWHRSPSRRPVRRRPWVSA
eukprot:scaffold114102_cov36-Phaeocystis_antarctica.AAC.2